MGIEIIPTYNFDLGFCCVADREFQFRDQFESSTSGFLKRFLRVIINFVSFLSHWSIRMISLPSATMPEQIIKLTERIDVSHIEQPEGSALSHGLTKANYWIKFHITEPLITSEIKVKHQELQRHDEWDFRVLCWIFRHTASGAVRWNVRLVCDVERISARNTSTRGTLAFNRRFEFPLLGVTFPRRWIFFL